MFYIASHIRMKIFLTSHRHFNFTFP